MSLSTILAAIDFYDGNESWASPAFTPMNSTDQASFIADVTYLYNNSSNFRTALESFVANVALEGL